jgi:hypothetical protein
VINPFVTALGALFNAPGSVAAIYTPKGGQPLPDPIRVIWAQGSQDGGGSVDRRIADTNTFDIPRSSVANPIKGDTIEVTDPATGLPATFKINGPAMLDVEGMTWMCPTEPA